MSSLQLVLLIAAVVVVGTWLAAVVTRDASWVDRIWSIVPVAYVWVFAAGGGWTARGVLIAVLVTLWGARLTFNFARKGGYTGTEDYRWPVLRDRLEPWQWQVFLFSFVSLYQNALLVAITLPAWSVALEGHGAVGAWDVALAVLFVLLLVGETVADQQQWEFHQRKHAAAAAGQTVRPGFLAGGLFRFSRHPNFFFEQAQWWVVWGFAVVAGGPHWAWTLAGPLLLTLLFVGSTRFTESLTAMKYPEYSDYQRRTSMLVPWPPRAASAGAPLT